MRLGGEPLGYSAAVEAVADLADLEQLEAQLSQGEQVSTLDDVDIDLLAKHLGREAVSDMHGASRSGTRARAAGLPDQRRRWPATDPASRTTSRVRPRCGGSSRSSTVRATEITTTSGRVPPTNRRD